MKEHVNFYENLKEAEMRIKSTVVLYDNVPHYVLAIADHKGDGVFRVYMVEVSNTQWQKHAIPYESYDGPNSVGPNMDKFMESEPKAGIIRKMMNSPKFNKFRPFPLGMANYKGAVVYMERSPVRHTQQGLTDTMVHATRVDINLNNPSMQNGRMPFRVPVTDVAMSNCILGRHPSFADCIKNLSDKDIANDAAAFDRHFAIVRGPLGVFYLAYKSDIVGYLPNGDASHLVVGRSFRHTKEVLENLGLFTNITVQK